MKDANLTAFSDVTPRGLLGLQVLIPKFRMERNIMRFESEDGGRFKALYQTTRCRIAEDHSNGVTKI